MKKLLLAVALAATLPAWAQSVVTTPTLPATTAPITVSPNATAALAQESTNRVFIDQSGSNPNVQVLQDGNANRLGSVERPVYLRGADQQVNITQDGNSNIIDLELVNANVAQPGTSVGASVIIQQIGNSNTVDAACGFGASSAGTALSGCNRANINWSFSGSNNSMQFRGTGNDLSSAVTVSGNNNTFVVDAVGNNHSQTVMVAGSYNTFNMSQTSTGAAGSSMWVEQTGANAQFNLTQSGTVDSVLNIKSVATGGVFNVTQKN